MILPVAITPFFWQSIAIDKHIARRAFRCGSRRIYLPMSELAHFQVAPEEILRLEYSSRFTIWPPASLSGRDIFIGRPVSRCRRLIADRWSPLN